MRMRWVLYLHSWLSYLMTNLSSLPQFMPDGLSSFQGHVNILEVLGHCNLLTLVVSCLYFPEDLLLVLSEI